MRSLENAGLKRAYYLQRDGEFQVQRVNRAVLARWNAPHPTLRNKPLLIPRRGVLGVLIALQSQNRCPNVKVIK